MRLLCVLAIGVALAWMATTRWPVADRAPAAPMPSVAPRSAPPSAPRRRLRWMGHWQGQDRRETLVREVAREFSFRHPDVELELRFPAEIMGVRSKHAMADFIIGQLRRPEPEWDVVWMDDMIYQLVADQLADPAWGRRHLVDFRGIPGFAAAHKPFIIEDPAIAEQTGGVLVGPYIEGQYLAWWVNRVLAERLGIPPPPSRPRWSDLLAMAAALGEARAAGRTEAYLLGESKDNVSAQFLFQALVGSRCPDIDRLRSSAADPAKRAAVREAVVAFAELARHRPLRPGHRELLWTDSRRLPLDDQVLCFIGGTWMFSHWSGIDAMRMTRMQPYRLPVFAEVDHAVGAYIPSWAVLAQAPGREDGIDLLMTWCTPDVAERWVLYTRNPTGLRGDLARVALSDDPFDRFMVEMERTVEARVHRGANPDYALGPAGATRAGQFHEVLRGLLAGELDAEGGWRALCGLAGWEEVAP